MSNLVDTVMNIEVFLFIGFLIWLSRFSAGMVASGCSARASRIFWEWGG